MNISISPVRFVLLIWLLTCAPLFAKPPEILEQPVRVVRESSSPSNAVLRVRADKPLPYTIPRNLTGKFTEHLHANVYKGMDAQVLLNPTFAPYPIASGDMTPDGLPKFLIEPDSITRTLRWQAFGQGWPEKAITNMIASRNDGLATFWMRIGPYAEVIVSPDTGPHVGRAQRVEVKSRGQGIAQWTFLPLHRVRDYEFEIFLRSPDISNFEVALVQGETNTVRTFARVSGVSSEWKKFTGTLHLDSSFSQDASCRLSLIANSPGQFVVQRILLRPADHINGADPDVVRLLKESKVPIHRWPGGNFVSAYHWRDGVGPFEQRPTLPNYAWGALETHLFGTDEYIAFCRAVGCEPMICVNGGTGTPEEAAQWIQYCNGATNTPMGKLRAANGHPEPYNVKHWEVGNELWGSWQANWTTPAGYADRYLQFAPVMKAADPSITLYACGAPVLWGKDWNDKLITTARTNLQVFTDHSLLGGRIKRSSDPLDVYRDYMAVPELLEKKWANLRQDMLNVGIASPKLAITELQIYPSLEGDYSEKDPLSHQNLVGQNSQCEALYDILMYHTAIRLSPFLEVITHSATVNHGGGLRKTREHVYANPCHYAQSAFAALAGATVLPVEIESCTESAPRVLPDLQNAVKEQSYSAIDAIAARNADGIWLSIVNRKTAPVNLTVELAGFTATDTAEVQFLTAELPWSVNRQEEPDQIKPINSKVALQQGKLQLSLPPYTVMRVRLPQKN